MTDRGAVCATRCGCGQYSCLACVSLVLSCIVPVLIAVTTLLHFVILAALAPHKLRVRDLPPDSPFFGLSADNLNDATAYTWVQLSDTHIKERNSTNTLVFERFCNEIISVLKPTFADFTRRLQHRKQPGQFKNNAVWHRYVVHTGDIVDNKKNFHEYGQRLVSSTHTLRSPTLSATSFSGHHDVPQTGRMGELQGDSRKVQVQHHVDGSRGQP